MYKDKSFVVVVFARNGSKILSKKNLFYFHSIFEFVRVLNQYFVSIEKLIDTIVIYKYKVLLQIINPFRNESSINEK